MWLKPGGEGEDGEGSGPTHSEEVGLCPGSKDGMT